MAGVPANSEHPATTGRPARRRAGARWVAALTVGPLLAAGLLAGCGGGEERSLVDDAARSVAGADRAGLREGGTATWAVDALPATLNAYQFEADEVTARIAAATLPMLHTVDEEGRPRLNEDFLRSAEVTATEPRQRVVYTLNPDAVWSDGRPLDAEDFAAQWKALRGEETEYWSASAQGYDRIEKVTAGPGKHQVEVVFTRPTAEWRALFSPLYPAEVTGDPAVFNEGSRTELPLFAGPFAVQSVDQEERSVTLARNPEWWGESALLDELVLRAVDRDERAAALREGSVDIAEVAPAEAARIEAADAVEGADDGKRADDGEGADDARRADDGKGEGLGEGELNAPAGPSPALDALHDLALARLGGTGESADATRRYAAAVAGADRTRERAFATREEALREQLRDFTVHRAYHPSYTQLTLNGSSEALEDEQVRWAIARALDREKLASQVHEPAGLPTAPLGSHLRVVGQHGYEDTSDALGATGAERAAELLEEAGWRLPADDATSDDKATGARAAALAPLSPGLPAAHQRAGLLAQAAGVLAEPAAEPPAEPAAEPAAEEEEERGEGEAEGTDGANGAPAPAGAGPLPMTAPLPTADEAGEAGEAEEAGEAGESDAVAEARRVADEAAREAGSLSEAARAPVRTRDGEPLSLRFVMPDGADAEPLRQVGHRIAAMLATVGIGTEISEVPADEYFERHVASGRFDLALHSWPATAYPAVDARPLFTKPVSLPGGQLLVEQNYARVGTDHIDQLLDRAAGALDEEEYRRLLDDADARIWAAAGSLPLFQRPQLVAVHRDLAGVGAFGLATPRFQDIGFRR